MYGAVPARTRNSPTAFPMGRIRSIARAILALCALATLAGAEETEGVFARDSFARPAPAPVAQEAAGGLPSALDTRGAAWAGRWERLELDVRGPAGAPILLVAGAASAGVGAADGGAGWDPSVPLVPLVDGRRDPAARLDAAGFYRGRWWIPDRFPLGSVIRVRAYALDTSGARALGSDLLLEVVDLLTFEGLATEDVGAAAGWSEWTTVGPGAAARGRCLPSGEHLGQLHIELEAELRWPDADPGERTFFAAASATPWPAGEPASGTFEWLARTLAQGQFAAAPLSASAVGEGSDARVPLSLSLGVTAGADGRLWLAVGTSPPKGRIERLRVVLRRAR